MISRLFTDRNRLLFSSFIEASANHIFQFALLISIDKSFLKHALNLRSADRKRNVERSMKIRAAASLWIALHWNIFLHLTLNILKNVFLHSPNKSSDVLLFCCLMQENNSQDCNYFLYFPSWHCHKVWTHINRDSFTFHCEDWTKLAWNYIFRNILRHVLKKINLPIYSKVFCK